MTSRTDYHGARIATLNAATDLYGANSAERAAVDKAWAAVNVVA
jgi:Zn-dependent metalloprotease